MTKHARRFFLILSFAAIVAGDGSQADITPEATAFLERLRVQRQGLPGLTLQLYHQPFSYSPGGPLLTYLPGAGLRVSMGSRSYHPDRGNAFHFTETGLLSTNDKGESRPVTFVDTLPHLQYCAPFLTAGVLSAADDTTVERDADKIRLIITTDTAGDMTANDRTPPHLRPVGTETVLVFSDTDCRFLELTTSHLRPGGKIRLAHWRVETWQAVNGIHLPRTVSPVTGLANVYGPHQAQLPATWTALAAEDIKKTTWPTPDRWVSVNAARTGDGLPPSALPNPGVAADYARALTAWRDGDLAAAQKGFEALLAASPGLTAPRARLLELRMLSDLPAAAEAWIAWLKEDFDRGFDTSCPVFLGQLFQIPPENEAAWQTLLIDNLDHPAAAAILKTRLAFPVPESFEAVRARKIETRLEHAPSPAVVDICLHIVNRLTSHKDRVEDAERLTAKCRETGAAVWSENPSLFHLLTATEMAVRAAKGATETWKEHTAALTNPTRGQLYELFVQHRQDQEFLPAFKCAIQLLKTDDATTDINLILPSLSSISYSNISLTEENKAELLEILSQDLPFELSALALQVCGRARFPEGVNAIMSRWGQSTYQDLDSWQLVRVCGSLQGLSGASQTEWTSELSVIAKLAMERLPDDETRALLALTVQYSPALADALKEYYDTIDPWRLDWNSFHAWLRLELKKAADSPEAVDKLVMTLGGDADKTRVWVEENRPGKSLPGHPADIPLPAQNPPVDWSDPAQPEPIGNLFYHPSTQHDQTTALRRVFKLSPAHRSRALEVLFRANLSSEEKSNLILAELDRNAPMSRGYWQMYVDQLIKAGKDTALERLYQNVLRTNPGDTSALTALHGLYVKENKSAEAAKLTLDYYPAIPIESSAACADMLRTLSAEDREKLSASLRKAAETAPEASQIRLAFALAQWDQYDTAAAMFDRLTQTKTQASLVFRIWLQAASKNPERTTEQARICRLQLERDPENLSFSNALYVILRVEGRDAATLFAKKLAATPGVTLEQGVEIVAFLRGQGDHAEALAVAETIKDAPGRRGRGSSHTRARLDNEEIECLKALGKHDELRSKSIAAIVAWTPEQGDYTLRQILERLARPEQPRDSAQTEKPAPDPDLCDNIAREIQEKTTDPNHRRLALIYLYQTFDQLPKAEKAARERVKETPDWGSYNVLMDIVKSSNSPDRFNQVLTLFEEASEKNPGTGPHQAYNLVAWVFQAAENEEVIRPVWEKYGQLNPVRQNRAHLARTAMQRGFNALAAELIEESDDDNATIMTQRAQLLMKSGHYETALTTFDKTRAFINRQPADQMEYQHQNLDRAIAHSVNELRGNNTELEKLLQAVGDPGDNLDRLRLVFNIKRTQFETSSRYNDPMRGKAGAEALDILEKMVQIANDRLSDADYYHLQYISTAIKDVDRIISAQNILIKQNDPRAKDYFRTLQVLHEINPAKAMEKGFDWAKETQTPAPFLQYLLEKKHTPEKGLEIINRLTRDEPDGDSARQCRPFKASWLIAAGKLTEGVALLERLDTNDVRGVKNYVTSQAILDAVHQEAIPLDKGVTLIKKVAGDTARSAYYWHGLAQNNLGKANPRVALTLAEEAVAKDSRDNFLETLAVAQALNQSQNWRENFQATIAKMNGDSQERTARVAYQLCRQGEQMDPIPPAMVDTVLALCQENPQTITRYGHYVNTFLMKGGKGEQLLSIYLDILRDARAIPADMSAEAAKAKRQEAKTLTGSISYLIRRDQSTMSRLEAFAKANPNHAEALELVGLEHQRQGRGEQARDAFAQVVQLRGADADAGDYYRLALVLASLGDADATQKNFREAVERDPDLAENYTTLMSALRFREKMTGKSALADIAIPVLEKALALNPDDENTATRLLIAHIDARTPGWMRKMKTACDQWLEKKPTRVARIVNSVCQSHSKADEVPEELVDLIAGLLENKEIHQRCHYEARQFFQRVGNTEITVRLARKALDTCEKPDQRYHYVSRFVEALDNSEDPGRIIPLLAAELPNITDWSQAYHLSSVLNNTLLKTKREAESAAVADKILAATPTENVMVRSQALALKGDKKAGATLLYDTFMAAPDRGKIASVLSALENAGMYQELVAALEKLFDISPESRGGYLRNYYKALIHLGRTDEVLTYIRKNAEDVARSGIFYDIGATFARERQSAALHELYKAVLAGAGQTTRRQADISRQFLYFFREAEDIDGLSKAGRALLSVDGEDGKHRESWLRTWRYAARRINASPRFCMDLKALVKERPDDTILLPVLEAELANLAPADLADVLGTVDTMLLENTPEALRTNVRLLTKANRPDDALTLLAALQKHHPDKITDEDTRTLIQAHVQAGDWDAAMAMVTTWREKAPADLTPLFVAAQIMSEAGRQPEAEARLAEAGKLAGNDLKKLVAFHAEHIRYFQRVNQPTQALDYWMTTLQSFPAVTREALPAIQKTLQDKGAYDPYLREAARIFASTPEQAEYLDLLNELIGQNRGGDARFALYFGTLEGRADINAFTKLLTVMRRDWDSDYQVSTAAEFIRIHPAQGEKMLESIVQVYSDETDRATLKEGLEKELRRGEPSPALLGIQARVTADEGNLAESAKRFAQAAEKATGVLKAALGICQARALAAEHPDQARKILAGVAAAADAGPLARTARELAANPIAELPFNAPGGQPGGRMNVIP
ncbi:MAG: hypothetical protein RRC34_01840 [Lentisphaeria bacterium]|nr:hypothetical protein [Lentisphaeria bacterium]